MIGVNKISLEQREILRRKSAQSLPDVPSLQNWTPQQFKDAITKVLFDNVNSFYYFINQIAENSLTFYADEDYVLQDGVTFYDEDENELLEFDLTNGKIKVHLKVDFLDYVTFAGGGAFTGTYEFYDNVTFGADSTIDMQGEFDATGGTVLVDTYALASIISATGQTKYAAVNIEMLKAFVNYNIELLTTNLTTGITIVDKAYKDGSGNTITSTYATKTELATEIGKITNGTTIVGKATKDASGNTITETYETKSDATSKLNTAKSYSDSNLNTAKAYTDASVLRTNLVSIIGEATQSINGLLSTEDKRRLDVLYALLGEQSDQDSVVDTISEVLAIFNQYPEGSTLVQALAAKFDKANIVTSYSDTNANSDVHVMSAKLVKTLIDTLNVDLGKVVDGTTPVAEATHATEADNATEAESATKDSLGNTIATHYYSKEDGFAIGLVSVTDYDDDTGIITLEYNSEAVTDITYDGDTGVVTFTY